MDIEDHKNEKPLASERWSAFLTLIVFHHYAR